MPDPREGDPRAPWREEPKAVRVCRLAAVEGHPPSVFPLPVSFVPRVTTGLSSEEEMGAAEVVAGGTLPAVPGTQTGRDSSWTLRNTCAELQTVHQYVFFFHYVVFLQTSKKSLLEASRRPKPETDFRDHVAWGWPSVFSGEWSPDLD